MNQYLVKKIYLLTHSQCHKCSGSGIWSDTQCLGSWSPGLSGPGFSTLLLLTTFSEFLTFSLPSLSHILCPLSFSSDLVRGKTKMLDPEWVGLRLRWPVNALD